jgi:hypothetical protein
MAKAEIKQRVIRPVVPVKEDYVELTLTLAEARVVFQLLGKTCGDCWEVATVHRELHELAPELPEKTHNVVIGRDSVGLLH